MVNFALELIYALRKCPSDKTLKTLRASLDEVVKRKNSCPCREYYRIRPVRNESLFAALPVAQTNGLKNA
jgi:hypothetical protein